MITWQRRHRAYANGSIIFERISYYAFSPVPSSLRWRTARKAIAPNEGNEISRDLLKSEKRRLSRPGEVRVVFSSSIKLRECCRRLLLSIPSSSGRSV